MAELLLDDGFENVEVEAVVVGEVGTSGTTGGRFTESLKATAGGERRSGLGLRGGKPVAHADGRRGRFRSKDDRRREDADGPNINRISTGGPPITDFGLEDLPRAPSERFSISVPSRNSCSSNSASIRS